MQKLLKTWFKRVFGLRNIETEYLRCVTYEIKHAWEECGHDRHVAVYRDFVIETGETVRLYGCIPGFGTRYYNIDVYEKDGILVEK